MSGQSRVRSVSFTSVPESRPVLGPAGNKLHRKPATKPVKKPVVDDQMTESKAKAVGDKISKLSSPASPTTTLPQCPSILRRNVSMTASWSSDASSCESSPLSVASSSSGRRRMAVRQSGIVAAKKKQSELKAEKQERAENGGGCIDGKKRCAWVTANSDLAYVTFHDEEWGVPVHDDTKLFELLCLSGALAEMSWSDILNKRHTFGEVFLNFDPAAISKLSEKKVTAPGSYASSLLSEPKLRSIVENARLVSKIIDEFGSFDKYIWNFVNNRPVVSQFRYPRQVPVKTSKAEAISKDLVKRGFRSVGPTVIYSFMQVAGLTNDHLMGCFRFQECADGTAEAKAKDESKTGPKPDKAEVSSNLI